MAVQRTHSDSEPAAAEESRPGRASLRLASRTLSQAWENNIFSEAAGAAFWQTLSLPPLLLGLLGMIGFTGDWFGPNVVGAVQQKLIAFAGTVFAGNVVHEIIAPTVGDILTRGHSEIVSVGFIISWWAGSSALASFVDAITAAYGQYGVRHPVWQRIVALLMYLVALVCAVAGLPLLALGPGLLPAVFPTPLRPTVAQLVSIFYYPATAALLVIALTTLYKAALPRKLPWWRGLPGAVLAMVVALLSSIGLRFYIRIVVSTGYTYGALATPIAFLLGAFMIGLAVILGAHFNSAIQEMWPAKPTRKQRRRWRRLTMAYVAERLQIDLLNEPPDPDERDSDEPDAEKSAAERSGAEESARAGTARQADTAGAAEDPGRTHPAEHPQTAEDTQPTEHADEAEHKQTAKDADNAEDAETAERNEATGHAERAAPSGPPGSSDDPPDESRADRAHGLRQPARPETDGEQPADGQARLAGGRCAREDDQSSPPGGIAS